MDVMNMSEPQADNLVPSMLPQIGNSRRSADGGFHDGDTAPCSPRPPNETMNLPQLVNVKNMHSNAQGGFSSKLRKINKPGEGGSQKIKSRFEDDRPSAWNPDPLPYQTQVFKSSTMMKKVSVPPRHQDTFTGKETTSPRQAAVILHTDRYQWDDPLNQTVIPPNIPMLMHALQNPHLTYTRTGSQNARAHRVTQRDRHRAEMSYMDRMRGLKRKREMLPHRTAHDLLLGGERAEFTERISIQDELNRLKSIALPDNARELYHGKGIHLPQNHASLKPRKTAPPDPKPDLLKSPQKASRDPVNSRRASAQHRVYSRSRLHSGASQSEDGLNDNKPWNQPVDINMQNMGLDEDPDRQIESEMDILLPQDEQILAPPATAFTTTKSDSRPKMLTPNPLKGTNFLEIMGESEREEMKKLFKKLDTDVDGHLTYPQVKSELSQDLTDPEIAFIKQVYDITSFSTFFGVDEFLTVQCLTKEILTLSGASKNAFEKLDFAALNDSIIQYVEIFQSVDRAQKGKISMMSLKELLGTALEKEAAVHEDIFEDIKQVIHKVSEVDDISMIEYLAHIPYFMSLEK